MNAPGPPSEPPPVEWFAAGYIDRPNKIDGYLLSPTHPDGKDKLRLWRSVFGISENDGQLLERLIREQLKGATTEEQPRKTTRENPPRIVRRWELVIPRFRSLDGREGPVLTAWAFTPAADRPHLTTAYPIVD